MSSQNLRRQTPLQKSGNTSSLFHPQATSGPMHTNPPMLNSSANHPAYLHVHSPDATRASVDRRWNKQHQSASSKSLFGSLNKPSDSRNSPVFQPRPNLFIRRAPEQQQHEQHLAGSSNRAPLLTPSRVRSTPPPPFAEHVYTGSSNDKNAEHAPPSTFPSCDISNDVFGQIAAWKNGLTRQLEVTASLEAEIQSLKSTIQKQSSYIASLESDKSQATEALHSKDQHARELESDLQSTRDVLERTQNDLDSSKADYEDAMQRIQEDRTRVESSKSRLKKKIEALAQSHSLSESSLKQLKTKFDDMTNFIGNLPHDLEHLKSTSAQALEAVEILLDQDSEYARGKSVRELVNDLHETAMKSQQVNEFLRDKLQTSGLEIIEAQNQIAKLEASSEERWREHCSTLSGVQSELRAVVDALQGEKQELVKDKKELLHQIELLTTITSEQDTLKAHLAEKEIVIDTQKAVAFAEHKRSEDLKTRLDELALTLNVRDTDIRQLQERLDAHETRLQDLLTQNQALRVQTTISTDKCSQLENQLNEHATTTKTANNLAEAQAKRNEGLKEEILNLTAELNQFKPRASVLEAELARITKERATLQERFETLTMNLQLSKDERLDLQESLTSTQRELDATSKTNVQLNEDLATLQADMVKLTLIHESTKNDAIVRNEEVNRLRGELERAQRAIVTTQDTVVQLTATTEGLKAELTFKDRSLFALEERLQLREDEHSSASKQRSLEHAASIRVFEERLHHRESEHNDAIHVYKERCQVTEKLLDSFETQTEALKKQVVHLSAEIEGVRDDLNAAQARPLVVPGDGGDLQAARIDELTLENSALTTTISSLQTLASTLPQRFEKGELSEGERNFVNGVVKTTRAIHEEQLVARGNELRRKDNAIMKLQSQVKELQASLARCLKDKGDETDKTSIVDLFLSNGSNVRDSRSMAHPPALDSNISKPHSTKKVPVKAIENVSIDQMERDESISSISDAGDLPMMPVLGKRGRGPTPTGPIEHARPIRRARTAAARKNDQTSQNRAKTRKR